MVILNLALADLVISVVVVPFNAVGKALALETYLRCKVGYVYFHPELDICLSVCLSVCLAV